WRSASAWDCRTPTAAMSWAASRSTAAPPPARQSSAGRPALDRPRSMRPLRTVLLLGLLSALATAGWGAASPVHGPERTVEAFYRWYVSQVTKGKDPLAD